MKQIIKYAPPNSIFFVEDSLGGVAPEIDHRIPRIWWSSSSLIVGTLAFMDGDTTLTVSYSSSDTPVEAPAAEVMLDCPSGELHVGTSHLDVLLRAEAVQNPVKVSVWINRPSEPDNIFMLIG